MVLATLDAAPQEPQQPLQMHAAVIEELEKENNPKLQLIFKSTHVHFFGFEHTTGTKQPNSSIESACWNKFLKLFRSYIVAVGLSADATESKQADLHALVKNVFSSALETVRGDSKESDREKENVSAALALWDVMTDVKVFTDLNSTIKVFASIVQHST